MTIARHQAWDDTEIAAVTVADLTAAIGLWLVARDNQDETPATIRMRRFAGVD
jgi:hypothetical protein